jgi:Cupin
VDALTDIIQLLRPRSVLIGTMTASGRWGVQVPKQPGPTFCFMVEGSCWFQADQGELVELHEGDYILSSKPIADTLFSEPGVEVIPSDDKFKASNFRRSRSADRSARRRLSHTNSGRTNSMRTVERRSAYRLSSSPHLSSRFSTR